MSKNKKSKEELEIEKKEKEQQKNHEKEMKKQERKEKNKENIKEIKKSFNAYAFVIKIVASIILIVFAILMFVNKKEAIFTMFIITAGIALFVAAVRCINCLVKKDELKDIKRITYIVSLIHALISVYLIIAAIILKNEDVNHQSDFTNFNEAYFPIFLAAILYSEAVGYFMNTVLFKSNSTKFMFWLHIIFITLAVVILALGKLDSNQIVVALGIISIICALFIGGEAIIGFFNFNNGKHLEESDKEKDKKEEAETLEAPTNSDAEPLVDPKVIDNDDSNDSAVIQ